MATLTGNIVEGKSLDQLKLSRRGKKGAITKMIVVINRLVSESGSRRKINALLAALMQVFEETQQVCERIAVLSEETDELNCLEEVRANIDECVADAKDYLEERADDPASISSFTSSWVRKCGINEEITDLESVKSNENEKTKTENESGIPFVVSSNQFPFSLDVDAHMKTHDPPGYDGDQNGSVKGTLEKKFAQSMQGMENQTFKTLDTWMRENHNDLRTELEMAGVQETRGKFGAEPRIDPEFQSDPDFKRTSGINVVKFEGLDAHMRRNTLVLGADMNSSTSSENSIKMNTGTKLKSGLRDITHKIHGLKITGNKGELKITGNNEGSDLGKKFNLRPPKAAAALPYFFSFIM